ncbi:MAG: glutamate--tRNA ligase [Bacteroidota bacterium]
MTKFRVRFAPSPTGPLHIGGVRTALYNYLLARQQGGSFILRIEDTDQTRYVPGAEAYIVEALRWCGLELDEGPGIGGDYGPYRQSERKDLYQKYAQQLLDQGQAYYAFDSAADLDRLRAEYEARKAVFRYDNSTRMDLLNSLTLPTDEVKRRLKAGEPYTVRLKIPRDEEVSIQDRIRGTVTFKSNELDDKIILKADGLPTYHLANIVDDHFMEISHVIRGEEWLPSTAHHIYLYRFLNWESTMPQFAHLPLILKPKGKGKLSKRDGAKLGIPVFPLAWEGDRPEDSFAGFREFGFLPQAVNNFLAFLGWNPGTEQELFSMDQLSTDFSLERIGKSGARFDYPKARWFNQQYLIATPDVDLVALLRAHDTDGLTTDRSDAFLAAFAGLMKERVQVLPEFWEAGYYFFGPVRDYETKMIRKKWKPERRAAFDALRDRWAELEDFTAAGAEALVKAFMEEQGWGFGDVLPILRLGLSGTMKGPSVFAIGVLLGREEVSQRLQLAYDYFDQYHREQASA